MDTLQRGLSRRRRPPAISLNGLEVSGGYKKVVPVWYLEKIAPFGLNWNVPLTISVSGEFSAGFGCGGRI